MRKVKANSSWNGLSDQQRETLEEWLFEERLGLREATERARKELGFTGSVSSLGRFYRRASEERLLAGFTEAQSRAEKIAGAPVSMELLRQAAMKVVGQLLLKRLAEAPEDSKGWEGLARLLLQSEENEIRRTLQSEENQLRREMKEEGNAIRRESLAFAREKFQFNMMEQAVKALPEIQELAEARMDPELRELEENKRINAIRRRMFGTNLPDMAPETLEEKAEMDREKALKAEASDRRHRELVAEARRQLQMQKEEMEAEDEQLKDEELEMGEGDVLSHGQRENRSAVVEDAGGAGSRGDEVENEDIVKNGTPNIQHRTSNAEEDRGGESDASNGNALTPAQWLPKPTTSSSPKKGEISVEL